MSTGSWLAQVSGVIFGIVAARELPGVAAPFSPMMELVMEINWFGYLIGMVLFTASLAAIMSTADSLLIAISQMIAVDVAYPIWPDARPWQISLMGKFFSVLSMSVAIGIVYAMDGTDGLSYFARLQFNIGLQGFPCMAIGLFAKRLPHPWTIVTGAAGGIIMLCSIEFCWNTENAANAIHSGVLGLATNSLVILSADAAVRASRSRVAVKDDVSAAFVSQLPPSGFEWDRPLTKRFGEPLTSRVFFKLIEGLKEPATTGWYVPTILLLMCLSLPMVASGTFSEPVALGWPNWVWKYLISMLAVTVAHLVAIWFWYDPSETVHANHPLRASISRRVSYDAYNEAGRQNAIQQSGISLSGPV